MTNQVCGHCGGRGRATYTRNTYYDYKETCHVCKGAGTIQVDEDDDPTPWCHACGAMTKDKCKCGPYVE